MKKILPIFFLCALFLLCGISAYAADDSGMWEYASYDSGVELTEYYGSQTDIYVPNNIKVDGESLPVIKLGDSVFADNTGLNSVTLGEGITEIGESSFANATNLVCIVTPESLTTIGDNAFSGCANFNSVILYDAVTSIGENAFEGCDKLTIYCNEDSFSCDYANSNDIKYVVLNPNLSPEIVIVDDITYYVGNGEASLLRCDMDKEGDIIINTSISDFPLTSIKKEAFKDCTKLDLIKLPNTIKQIEEGAFYNCSSLQNVYLPNGIRNIPKNLFYNCTKLDRVDLNDNITNLGVYAFYNCSNLKTINIPKKVTEITNYLFYGCYMLNNIQFGDNIVEFGEYAFYGCTSLETINIPYSLTCIGKYSFNSCINLKNVFFGENKSLNEIGSCAFENCYNLQNIIFPVSLTSIGPYAFHNCNALTDVIIPSSVRYIDGYAFLGCDGLKTLKLNEGIEEIGAFAFSVCKNLKSIQFPNSLKAIETYAFSDSGLISIDLPKNLVRIGECAFIHSYELKSVVLPESLVEIGGWAFNGCAENLTIYCYADSVAQQYAINETIRYFIISDEENVMNWEIVDGNLCITGKGPMPDYTSTNLPEWHNFAEKVTSITISEGITSVGTFAFHKLENLKTATIPSSVTNIGTQSFSLSSIEYISLSNGLTQISNHAFQYCCNLKEVVLPDTVKSLGDYSFYECKNLERFICGTQLESIGIFAFNKCGNLSKFVARENLKNFGIDIFLYCGNLKTAGPIGGGYNYEFEWTDKIPKQAFQSCPIISIIMPESITTIGERAFDECSGLKNITVPKNTIVESYAFYACSNLTLSCYYLSSAYVYAVNSSIKYLILDDVPIEGICGSNATWEYKNSTLYINGTGMLFEWKAIPEWLEYRNCIEYIVINEGITGISSYAFFNHKNVREVILPNGLTTIGSSAFQNCSMLTKIVIPASVSVLGGNMFYGCVGIKSAGPIGGGYNYEFGWEQTIPANAFSKLSYLESIEFPETINEIGDAAFSYCEKLSGIILPKAIDCINESTFCGCTSLVHIDIPSNVKNIERSAFHGCSKLSSISFCSKKLNIHPQAFDYVKELKTIYVDTLENWINTVFPYSSMLNITNLYVQNKSLEGTICIPDGIKLIDRYKFYNCKNIEKLILPEGIGTICNDAFTTCTGISFVVIPKSVRKLYNDSFHSSTILCVYEGSYAYAFAMENNLLYFVIPTTSNPEISYGQGITGTVTYTDGTPASNATVEILYDDGTVKETVTTDADGNYSFTYAEVGRYTIRVTDSKGNTASEIISVKRMNVFNVYLAGETDLVFRKGYDISGTVSPSTAKITLSDTSGNIIKSVDVVNGAFTFSDISRGSYIVKAENEIGSVMTEVYVSNEDVTGIALEIKAQSATITGDVKIENRDGTFASKIWVNIDLIDSDGNVVSRTTTDENGAYTFENVPAGNYNIVAKTSEMRPAYGANFDKSFELTGYGYLEITAAGEYVVDTIILREEKINLTSVSGKVTANGTTQDCQVILTNENGDQIAVFVTDKNGKYNFVNIPDGMYCITAITKVDGMGYTVITIENGVVHGDTDIKVAKADKISKREPTLLSIPDCNTKVEAILYKEAVMAEKAFYDSLSDKERKQLSEEWIEKLFKLVALISDSNIQSTEGVIVENVESVISPDEIEETITFTLTVTETAAIDADEDGITTEEEYETEKIKDKKGKNKNIAKYYDITFAKGGKNISNIRKQTETNGKLRITMEIPEEHRGHKHYTFVHMHKGEAVTLVDLDDNPDTVTFEIDKFSTFALAYSDVELIGEVEGGDPADPDPAIVVGDANGDGEVDFVDAVVVLKHDVGISSLTDDNLIAADTNSDGEVDFVDAIQILKYDCGLISSF